MSDERTGNAGTLHYFPLNIERLVMARHRGLTAEQERAHINLQHRYWERGGSLLDDDKFLRVAADVDARVWRKYRAAFIALSLYVVDDGRWTDPWLETKLAERREALASRRAAGRAGGKKSAAARRPAPIADDWRPSEDDVSHAVGCRLNAEGAAEEFRDIHLAKGTVAKSWSGMFRAWCDSRRPAPRVAATTVAFN